MTILGNCYQKFVRIYIASLNEVMKRKDTYTQLQIDGSNQLMFQPGLMKERKERTQSKQPRALVKRSRSHLTAVTRPASFSHSLCFSKRP